MSKTSEKATSEVATEVTGLMNVPVTPAAGKTGEFHTVWGKKDLQGNPTRMAVKADDRVTNKGEEVIDPATGELVYLVRVHRAKRVWYGKALITDETRAHVAAARAAAAPAAAPAEETAQA